MAKAISCTRRKVLELLIFIGLVTFSTWILFNYTGPPAFSNKWGTNSIFWSNAQGTPLSSRLNCSNFYPVRMEKTHGGYTVETNFLGPERRVPCHEFVTFTTHGDYRYLGHLIPLVTRWQAPVSVALYVPSISDVQRTVSRIVYLRECKTRLIKEWVSFHLFAETKLYRIPHAFYKNYITKYLRNPKRFCLDKPQFFNVSKTKMREDPTQNLTYPINLGRNIARLEAATYFVLSSDIEFYPSADLSKKFIEFIKRRETPDSVPAPRSVFVLPIFEIETGVAMPRTKDELVPLLLQKKVTPFHEDICKGCYNIPNYSDWVSFDSNGSESLNVFQVRKWRREQGVWEPTFIATDQQPLYDERLSGEGIRKTMAQTFALCLLNYNFVILDNGFLTRRHGMNQQQHNPTDVTDIQQQQRKLIKDTVRQELIHLYGEREGCVME